MALHTKAPGLHNALTPAQQKRLSDDFFAKAVALHQAGKLTDALSHYDQAIALNPHLTEAYNNSGVIHYSQKQYAQSLLYYDKALAVNPKYADAYNNRGLVLYHQKHYGEALTHYDKALALNPRYAEAYNNRGLVLYRLRQYNDALANCDKALALNPQFADAYNNRGITLYRLQRFSEALADFEKAIALKPAYAEALYNKGFLKLLLGEFEEGWKLHEWRWKKSDYPSPRALGKPLWLGEESVAGKTILVHAEQGFGDVILFSRYAGAVERLGAKIILEVPKPLVALLGTMKGSHTLVAQGSAMPAFDFHCPMMSLPLALKTTPETIPKTPYIFTDKENLTKWRERLGTKSRPRIGLAWSGSPTNPNDANRSMPASLLAPLLHHDVEYHAIQKEFRPQDAEFLKESPIITHADELHDFLDTASLISEMDLVLSVDTSVAHITGALDKKLWLLLPWVADFRWMTQREDSPWYPSARLFRQPRFDDWGSVIAKVSTELATVI